MMKVGQFLIVNKRSVVNPKTGRCELIPAKLVRQRVEAVYHHGAVRTVTGDVWTPVLTRMGWVGAY